MPPDQRAHAGAVDRGHFAHVDDHALHALLQAGLDFLLELFGGAAGDQALLRGQNQLPRLGPLLKQICHPSQG